MFVVIAIVCINIIVIVGVVWYKLAKKRKDKGLGAESEISKLIPEPEGPKYSGL